MKKKFSEIQSNEDRKIVNEELRTAISNLSDNDKRDGYTVLALVEEKKWFGKLEYPVESDGVKCSFNIKKGVFHSSQIYLQKGRWRFTRTEFNRSVEFKGEKSEKNSTDSE
jgi:hypothetical protein